MGKKRKNKKKNKKAKSENVPFFGRRMVKLVLSLMAGLTLFSSAKSQKLEDLLSQGQRITQTTRGEQSLNQIYQTWMMHYNPEGIYVDELRKKSPLADKLIEESRNLSRKKIQETIGKPFEDLLRSHPPRYESLKSSLIVSLSTELKSEKLLKEKYNELARAAAFKGFDEVQDYTKKNKALLDRLSDDDFAFWALNTAYFLVRKNFRPGAVPIQKKEDLDKAIKEGIADCEIATSFTRDMYLFLIKNFNRKHLSKKVSLVIGSLVDKKTKKGGSHAWIIFTNYGLRKIVETNDTNDAILYGTNYNPNKCFLNYESYLRSAFPDKFYIPLFSTYVEPATNNKGDYMPYRKIHILPSEIEKEILEH